MPDGNECRFSGRRTRLSCPEVLCIWGSTRTSRLTIEGVRTNYRAVSVACSATDQQARFDSHVRFAVLVEARQASQILAGVLQER